jgi:MOSC domain-containing protein YiiM
VELLSVSVALPREREHAGKTIRTGIFKRPLRGPVHLGRSGLAGDGQADRVNHGGVDKAAYVYSAEDYEYWRRELGREDLSFGTLGENFCITDTSDDVVRVGDVLRIGEALVRVTQPRVPCFKLGIAMGDAAFVKRFAKSRRTGFYVAVLEEGRVESGDRVALVERDPLGLTVRELFGLLVFREGGEEVVRQALGSEALSAAWRSELEALLGSRA